MNTKTTIGGVHEKSYSGATGIGCAEVLVWGKSPEHLHIVGKNIALVV
jgi:hypothetical protein